ncbi:MAG: hypothetical protein H5T45_01105 [Thermoplasmatales archaeon]|nr:hypothetical protein [Thermoplasmatales archaeon]
MRPFFLPLIFFLFLTTIFIPFSYAEEKYPFLINLRIEAVNESIAEIEPFGSYWFKFKYYNGGNFQKNYYAFYVKFSVEVEGSGWQAFVDPEWAYFYPNETKIGQIRVVASERPSNYAYITLHGELYDIWGNIHPANYTFQIKSSAYHTFDVKMERNYIEAKQEQYYTIPVKIKNYGNYEERFSIIIDYCPSGWLATVSQNPVIIPPKGEEMTYLSFVVPHEKLYLQRTVYFIRYRVDAISSGSSKVMSILVVLEGGHLTLGQIVALASSMPSLLILVALGVVFYRRNNLCTYVPKMWVEEKEELLKMNKSERKKAKKELKEAWKSAVYFCKSYSEEEKEIKKLRKIANKKQRKIEEKIIKTYEKMNEDLKNAWKEECRKIDDLYERRKKRVKQDVQKIYPAEPKRVEMPDIPKYEINEEKFEIIEPNKIKIKELFDRTDRDKLSVEREILKIREMGNEIREKINRDFDLIEKMKK